MMGPPMFDVAFAGSSVRASESEFKRIMGIPDEGKGIPKSLLDFARQPADEAWVFKCVHLKAMAAQSVPLRVEVKDGKEWVPLDGKSDGAGEDLQFLLDDVNPAWEGAQLQAYTSAAGSVFGGSYWLLISGKYGGVPQEIHWLSGADVEAIMGKTFPEQYEYRPPTTAMPKRYGADVIVPFRDTVNLQDPYRLLSPLSAVRYEISTSKQAAEWNDALLRNWGIPAGAWTADPQADIGSQDRSYIKRALRALRGPANQGKQPILPAGLKWTQLSMSQQDADWIATRKVSRMTISAVLGVPLVLAGDDEKASVYASTRDAERVFWRQTMINELDHRAVPINAYLLPKFDPTRKKLRVAYDYTGVEALRGAPTEEMAQWLEAVKEGLPLNRYIKHFGLGDPVEGGDEAFKHQMDAAKKAEAEVQKAEALAKQPRPEEYDTPKKSGAEPPPSGDKIRALSKGLYKHPAVRAFLASGDTTGLSELVPPEELDHFVTGLRRRYSVKQILDGDPTRDYAGLAHIVPPTVEPAGKELEDLQTAIDRLAAEVNRPRKLRRIAKRDATGRIVAVDEIEIK